MLISDKNVYLEVILASKQGEKSEVISTCTQACVLPVAVLTRAEALQDSVLVEVFSPVCEDYLPGSWFC